MKQIPDYSIVIPCKNEAGYIGILLESIRRQTVFHRDVPVIVADAHSTDGTLDILKKIMGSGAMNLTVIPGGLPAAGRNRGAMATNSDYIIFLDADIELGESTFLEKALEKAVSEDLDCVTSFIRCRNGNAFDHVFWYVHGLFARAYRFLVPFSTGMFTLMSRSAFLRLGGYDERVILGEDFELTHKVPKDRFGIADTFIYTTNRRFRKTGYLRTIRLYTGVYLSRAFRQKDHSYYFQ